MALESATFISQLVQTNPTASDPISQGDDHIRMMKVCLQTNFPNLNAVTPVNPTPAEFNYLVGVTSGIQAQLAALVTSIGQKVIKAGDVMTGFLTLSADPTSALHAVTKQYADVITTAMTALNTALAARVTTLETNSVITKKYSSGIQNLVLSTTFTFTHGLGAFPSSVQLVATCKTADIGYSIGDKVILPCASNATQGITMYADATNIFIKQSNAMPQLTRKDTNSTAGMTSGSWDLSIIAIA